MPKKQQKLRVQEIEINIFVKNKNSFVSLTDIARYKDQKRSDYILQNWMRTRNAIEFLGLWEKLNNPHFKSIEFDGIKKDSGLNSFVLTPKKWIAQTKAVGLISKTGRYGGGTFAHIDIAYEFASWISPEFKLYLIKEFYRLKEEESIRLAQAWDVKRILSKVNYKIHTDAVKLYLIPKNISKNKANMVFANEADVLNLALFGRTAQEWRNENMDKDGNIRDYADVIQLVVLANLEGINAELIRQDLPQPERLIKLNQIAITQIKSLINNNSVNKLKD